MWLVVGLGNPGPRYAGNRHNLGFMVADELARRAGIAFKSGKFGGDLATGLLLRHKIQLLKPMDYMNRSGFATQRAASFYDVAPERICVIHDEADFEFGRVAVKNGGGHGGHNGLRSVHQQLGSSDYARVRCGVGRPEHADHDVADFLLSDFAPAQAPRVQEMIDRAATAVEAVVAEGVTAAMNRINGDN
jgi:PTH1 family peptidyl-tRNA hydrolase